MDIFFCRNCSGESDLANYQNVLSTLTAMTQEQVIKQLNCEMPCTHQEYTLSREADRFRSREQADVGADISLVGFMIKDGVVDITHETQMYDENDFISDFGGMMGLLLGASVLSLYELLAEVLKKCYTRLFNRDAYP